MSRSASETVPAGPPQPLLHPRRTWRRVAPLLLGGIAGLALLLGVLNFYARGSQTLPSTGVVWADAPAGVIALQIDPRGVAAAAGLKVGDLLLKLNGAPMASALEAEAAPWEASPGQALTLQVRRAERTLEFVLDPQAQEGEGQLYAYVATVGLFFLVSGIYLLYRLGVGRISLQYYVLCLSAFAVLAFSHTGEGTWLDWTFYSLDSLGRLLFPALMLHFVSIFPGRTPFSLIWRILIYFPALLFGAVTVWMVALGGALRMASPVLSLEHLDNWELLYTAAFFTACMAVLSIRSTRATILSERRQLRWMAWGLGLGIMPFVVFYLVPRGLEVQTPPPASLSVLPLIILPLAFSAATLKYRLADLGLLVREGVTALTLIFFSLALFVLLNLTLRRTFSLPGMNDQIFTVLAAVLVFLFYPPLRQAVSALVDRAFYQGRYDYRRTLLEFGRELNAGRELAPLMARFHHRIRRTLPVRHSVLLCADENRGGLALLGSPASGSTESMEHHLPAEHPVVRRVETEECVNLDRDDRRQLPAGVRSLGLHALFPMRVEGKLVAVLGVELKDPDGEMNSEDRQFLITLAGHAAAAIEGARLAEENLDRIREVELLRDYNESIVESSQVGILVLDIGYRIRGWNRTLERMSGLSRATVQDRHVREVFPAAFVNLLDGVPDDGRRVERFDLTLGNERARTFNLAVAALRGKGGGPRGQVVTFDDVTDQVRMEQTLLQNERLAAVGLLASGVAHEINTPLAGISSYAEMLVADLPADDSVREILERIRKQSWRASHIANSLLNFSRGDGQDLESVNLNEIVDETLALFGPQLKGRGVSIDFQPAPSGSPEVRGHRGRLQQVLLNLLLNARDAMGEGGCIAVATRVAGEETLLEVRDTGRGIAAENLERIYDPFFTTKRRGRGTGLGLSISYRIVQDHGGMIDVHSRPGEGSCFCVRFPLCRPERVPA